MAVSFFEKKIFAYYLFYYQLSIIVGTEKVMQDFYLLINHVDFLFEVKRENFRATI